GQVAARLPGPRVLDDRRVERDDVIALLEHRPPPLRLDIVLQQHPVVAVVVARPEAAVDLAAGQDEPAPLAQRDDLVHRDDVVGHGPKDAIGGRACAPPSGGACAAGDRPHAAGPTSGGWHSHLESAKDPGLYFLKRCRSTSTGATRVTP